MRQTNVFWVVVYMGGIEAFHAIRRLKPRRVMTPWRFFTLLEPIKFYWTRYAVGDVRDPRLKSAWPDGRFLRLCLNRGLDMVLMLVYRLAFLSHQLRRRRGLQPSQGSQTSLAAYHNPWSLCGLCRMERRCGTWFVVQHLPCVCDCYH
jgi:hypothetical protein